MDERAWLAKQMIRWGPVGVSLFALLAVVLAFAWGAFVFNPVREAHDGIAGLVRSPDAVRCLDGWTETAGLEPDGQHRFKSCTDGRIIITVRENQRPVGFDQVTGTFLKPEEVAEYLR